MNNWMKDWTCWESFHDGHPDNSWLKENSEDEIITDSPPFCKAISQYLSETLLKNAYTLWPRIHTSQTTSKGNNKMPTMV